MTLKTVDRIEVVDALRGIALFAIVIVQTTKRFVILSQNDLCDFHVY